MRTSLSPGKHSVGSLMGPQATSSGQPSAVSANSSPVSQTAGGVLQYVARPAVAADRSSINSILNLLGADRKSTRLNSSHVRTSRMPSSA